MDIFLSGLSTAGTGIIVVFIGLTLLILSISVMALFRRRGGKPSPVAEITPEPLPAPETPPQPPMNDDALIAVLAAAVAAVWQGEKSGFVVRRVRRVNNAPSWNASARDEQLYSHM